ncbi:MAG: CDC27 family protein, partial [Thermodesulfobacteriota bacterium]|nr:CDC27 family protein [Thermodesulfobacteriota bacterium]
LFGWPEELEEKEKKEEKEKVEVYTGEKISLDFFKTDIHNVFRLFAEISGKNIIVDDEVEGDLTLALKEVPWDLAMDIILDLKGLAIEEKLNTFIVKPIPEKAEADKGRGELVVRKFSEEILQPARILKRKKENRQEAQELILKAHNLESQGNHEDALSLYEKAFDIWKDNIDLIKKTAYLHYILGNFSRSYYLSGEALRLNPKDSGAALYAALSAARMGKPDDARQLFEVATKKAGQKIPEAFYDYGLFLEKEKDYGNALYIYRRHEDLFGPSLEVSMAIARLYEAQTRINEACKRYREISFSGFSMDRNTESAVLKKIQTLCNQGED